VNSVTDEEDPKPTTKGRDREQTTAKPAKKPDINSTRRPQTVKFFKNQSLFLL